jgi:hypothetical protein
MFSPAPLIELHTFYSLKMLTNHRGAFFQLEQEHAKIIHLENEEKLILPLGTLRQATSRCWHHIVVQVLVETTLISPGQTTMEPVEPVVPI